MRDINENPVKKVTNQVVKNFDYGDVIPTEWLYKQFGIKFPAFSNKKNYDSIAFRFLNHMDELKKILLIDHKMYLVNMRGTGYRIVMPRKQASETINSCSKKFNKIMRDTKLSLLNINIKMIDNDDIRYRDEQLGKIAALSAFATKKLT